MCGLLQILHTTISRFKANYAQGVKLVDNHSTSADVCFVPGHVDHIHHKHQQFNTHAAQLQHLELSTMARNYEYRAEPEQAMVTYQLPYSTAVRVRYITSTVFFMFHQACHSTAHALPSDMNRIHQHLARGRDTHQPHNQVSFTLQFQTPPADVQRTHRPVLLIFSILPQSSLLDHATTCPYSFKHSTLMMC